MLRALRAGLLLATLMTQAALAAEGLPYDETANARADIATALAEARVQKKQVLVVFGANWCKDCRELARKMAGGKLAGEIVKRYVVAKVDIGNWDRNQDVAADYGNPSKKGIPAVVVINTDGKALKATSAGELASARDMGEAELLAVFSRL